MYSNKMMILSATFILSGVFCCEAEAMDRISRSRSSTEPPKPTLRIERSPKSTSMSMKAEPIPAPTRGNQTGKEPTTTQSLKTEPIPIPTRGTQAGKEPATGKEPAPTPSLSPGTITSKFLEVLSPRSGNSGTATPKGKSPPSTRKGGSLETSGKALTLICDDFGFSKGNLGLPTHNLLKLVIALHEAKGGAWPTLEETIEAIQSEVQFGTITWESFFEDRLQDQFTFKRLKTFDFVYDSRATETERKLAKAIQADYIYVLLSQVEILELEVFETKWEELLKEMYGEEQEGEEHGSLEAICKDAVHDPKVPKAAKKWLQETYSLND